MSFRVAILLGLVLGMEAAEWEQGNGFRRKAVQPVGTGKAGFTLLTNAAIGVTFTNNISDGRVHDRHYIMNGSGVAVGDLIGTAGPTFSSRTRKARARFIGISAIGILKM